MRKKKNENKSRKNAKQARNMLKFLWRTKKKQDQGKPLPSIRSILNEQDGGELCFCFDFFCDDEVCFLFRKVYKNVITGDGFLFVCWIASLFSLSNVFTMGEKGDKIWLMQCRLIRLLFPSLKVPFSYTLSWFCFVVWPSAHFVCVVPFSWHLRFAVRIRCELTLKICHITCEIQ